MPKDKDKAMEAANKKNGVNTSLYLSRKASKILDDCKRSTRRTKSVIVSLLIEKYSGNLKVV